MALRSGMVRFHESLRPLMVGIDTVRQHPENYNNGDVDELQNSILSNGMYRPIYIGPDGTILAGNTTWEACKALGAEVIPVVEVEGPDRLSLLRILVADNVTAGRARPDEKALLNLMDELNSAEMLHGSGISEEELEVFRAKVSAIDDIPYGAFGPPKPKPRFHECPGCGERFQCDGGEED